MTSLDTSAHMIAASESWAVRLGLPLETAVRRLAAWRDARATRKALRRLSAHELDDIGLSREAVEGMTWGR